MSTEPRLPLLLCILGIHFLVTESAHFLPVLGVLGWVQWLPREGGPLSAAITAACYNCDSSLVFAAFTDGTAGIFDGESLRPRCVISPNVYGAPGYGPLMNATEALKRDTETANAHSSGQLFWT